MGTQNADIRKLEQAILSHFCENAQRFRKLLNLPKEELYKALKFGPKFMTFIDEYSLRQNEPPKTEDGGTRTVAQEVYWLCLREMKQQVKKEEGLSPVQQEIEAVKLTENTLKEIFNSQYGLFNEVLEQQRKVKIAELQQNKPKFLWHTSYGQQVELNPGIKENYTMYHESKGFFVFATSGESQSFAYGIKEPKEEAIANGVKGPRDLRGFYMGGYAKGEEFCLLGSQERTLNYMKKNPSYRYWVPSGSFEPVVSKYGAFDDEWTSAQFIKLDIARKDELRLEDIMKAGVQILFVKDAKKHSSIIKEIKDIPVTPKQYFRLLEMKERGDIIHQNALQKISPVTIDDMRRRFEEEEKRRNQPAAADDRGSRGLQTGMNYLNKKDM